MKWFKHSSTASHDLPVRRILDAYGYQGVGIFWCIVERVVQNDERISLEVLVREFGCKSFNNGKVRTLIRECGFFILSEDESSVKIADSDTEEILSKGRAKAETARANKVNNLDKDKEKEKKKKDIKKDSSKDAQICVCMSESERIFLEKMRVEYPRVSSMKQPLTYAQFLRLQKKLSKDELLALLNDMENYPKLTTNCLSANLTIQSWHNRNSHRK